MAVRIRTAGFALAVILIFTAWGGTASAATAPITIGTTTGHAIFAEPATGSDPSILSHLKSLIDGTPCGGRIRAGINSISDAAGLPTDIKNALAAKAASPCNTIVQVVMNGDAKDSTGAQNLRSALGTARFEWCDHDQLLVAGDPIDKYGAGCISTRDGGMHAKYFLFSSTGGRSCVSWFGSANLTPQTGMNSFNNGISIYNHCPLHDGFVTEIFNEMWVERSFANNDFYNPGAAQGYFTTNSQNLVVHASPEKDADPDFVHARFNNMTSGNGCTVGVAQAEWKVERLAIAQRLAQLRTNPGGCSVGVILGHKFVNGVEVPNADSQVLSTLHNAGIPIEYGEVHDKYFFLEGGGKPKTVLTGSHNMSGAALRRNDELLVEIKSSASVYSAYWDHWFRTLGSTTVYTP
jgi:hypothetical protein